MFPGSQSSVQAVRIVLISFCNIEFFQGNKNSISPGGSCCVFFQDRDRDTKTFLLPIREIGLFPDSFHSGKGGIFCPGPGPHRSFVIADSRKDHVPVLPIPCQPVCVSGKPLLLGTGVHQVINLGVGEKAAAGPTVIVMEKQRALHVNLPHEGGLGNCPHHVIADREVLHTPPEIAGSVVVVISTQPTGITVQMFQTHFIRRRAQPGNLHIVANFDRKFLRIIAGEKIDSNALLTKLIGFLFIPQTV